MPDALADAAVPLDDPRLWTTGPLVDVGRGLAALVGMPIYATHHVERGKAMVTTDLGRRGGQCVFEGLGLLRGVAYRTPDVERGYLLGPMGAKCRLLDAATGQVVTVRSDEAIEVEERYRTERLGDAYRDAFRSACIDVMGEDPDDWL